jgi:hypothetical protein
MYYKHVYVILNPREGTLIYLNLSLLCPPLPSSLTLDLFDQLRLDCLYL